MNHSIVSLTIENVKRIQAVQIEPHGTTVVIGGRNAQGKSTVLDCIEMALNGARSIPAVPIRHGEASAYIILETEELRVARTFNRRGSEVVVTDKSGAQLASPQALLNKLVGPLSFDPCDFARRKPKEQWETLRSLLGLDFAALDHSRKLSFDERTLETRELKRIEGQAASHLYHPDAPPALLDVDALREQLGQLRASGANAAGLQRQCEQLRTSGMELASELKTIRAEIERLQAREIELTARFDARKAEYRQAQEDLKRAEAPDTSALEADIRDAQTANEKLRANAARAEAQEQLAAQREVVARITREIDACDREKARLLADAKYPIPGLGLGADGVTYQGIPFEQCSSAEQLRISLAMGLALNRDLKLMLIREGSVLDAESLAIVREMAAAAGAQVWIERVGVDSEVQVIIEDGLVDCEHSTALSA